MHWFGDSRINAHSINMSKRTKGCTCRKGVIGSYVNCPVHNLKKQLHAHKTKEPVINEIGSTTNDWLKLEDQKKEREYDQMQRVFDYCKDKNITTDQLLEQHRMWSKEVLERLKAK